MEEQNHHPLNTTTTRTRWFHQHDTPPPRIDIHDDRLLSVNYEAAQGGGRRHTSDQHYAAASSSNGPTCGVVADIMNDHDLEANFGCIHDSTTMMDHHMVVNDSTTAARRHRDYHHHDMLYLEPRGNHHHEDENNDEDDDDDDLFDDAIMDMSPEPLPLPTMMRNINNSVSPPGTTIPYDFGRRGDDDDGGGDHKSMSTASSFVHYSLTLQPQDVICGRGTYQNYTHPGNVTFHKVVQEYIVPYGKATKDIERDTIVSNIYAEVQSIYASATGASSRFLIPAPFFQEIGYCREATEEEIRNEIQHAIRLRFDLIPTAKDVLFGRGVPGREHSGNRNLREFIEPLRHQYAQSNDKQIMVQMARNMVTQAGGRFLMPYDKSHPADGCILADPESIHNKITHLFRDKRTGKKVASNKTNLQERDDPSAENHAVVRPMFNHFAATLVPKSISSFMTSSSSLTNTQFVMDHTTPAKTPPHIIKIKEGPSVSSTFLVNDEASNTAISCTNVPSPHSFCSKFTTTTWLLFGSMIAFILAVVITVVILVTSPDGSSDTNTMNVGSFSDETSPTLRAILERDHLVCGVANQDGYSAQDLVTRQWYGFEVDLCRAAAAGIFGVDRFASRYDPLEKRASEPVKYVALEATERFTALNNNEIDLLLAVTTQNMERNIYEPTTQKGYTFSTPYLVNGLIFAGHPDFLGCLSLDNNSTTIDNNGLCDDVVVCVLDGTTHVGIVHQTLPGFETQIVTPSTIELFFDYFKEGVCNILAGEQVDLSPMNLKKRGYIGPYEMGTDILSKELISMVTRDGDAKFSDFCNWQIESLFSAEEMRLLRLSDVSPLDLPTTLLFGKRYESMFQDAFKIVGDYGHLYDMHLESYVPRVDANQINLGNQAGMYSIEFGTLQTINPPPVTLSSKIREIQTRRLVCGIPETPIFAELNEANEWVGLDVDYCKAISAALFDGKTTEVTYKVLHPSNRFQALLSGEVDVLARVTTLTMERDVQERETGVGFSFSYPNFHDRIRFAGIPKFVQCAENRDWTSVDCSELIVCVTAATTQYDVLSKIFPEAKLRISNSTSENVESFGDGACNVIAAGSVEVSKASIEKWYQGEYVVGLTPLSRESLALVTTEEDPVWSKFVNWIVLGLVYAEEHGITQDRSSEMPRVDLFGPQIGDQMLRHAVRAVGSYGEIWSRNAAANGLERDGRNQLNTYPLEPLLISDLTWDRS